MEASFKEEISRLLLRFKNPETEQAYTHYKLHERTAPTWFKWYMILFIGFLIFRKGELLVFSILGVESVAMGPKEEGIAFVAAVVSYSFEAVPVWCPKFACFRGLSMLIGTFYGITSLSTTFCSEKPAITPLYNDSGMFISAHNLPF